MLLLLSVGTQWDATIVLMRRLTGFGYDLRIQVFGTRSADQEALSAEEACKAMNDYLAHDLVEGAAVPLPAGYFDPHEDWAPQAVVFEYSNCNMWLGVEAGAFRAMGIPLVALVHYERHFSEGPNGSATPLVYSPRQTSVVCYMPVHPACLEDLVSLPVSDEGDGLGAQLAHILGLKETAPTIRS